jgi:predicted phosphoribosyltransferase
MTTRFYDRRDAGKYLAEKIKLYIKNNFNSEAKKESFIVMAIPRGGVIIGDIIASELNIDMDIIISKKIGAENNPELAIGAIMADGSYILNEDIVNRINISDEYIQTQVEIQKKEIERRLMEFRGKKDYHNKLKDRVTILVDDGIATGATVLAAVKWIKEKQHCKG